MVICYHLLDTGVISPIDYTKQSLFLYTIRRIYKYKMFSLYTEYCLHEDFFWIKLCCWKIGFLLRTRRARKNCFKWNNAPWMFPLELCYFSLKFILWKKFPKFWIIHIPANPYCRKSVSRTFSHCGIKREIGWILYYSSSSKFLVKYELFLLDSIQKIYGF